MSSLSFPETTDRTLGSVAQISEPSSAAAVVPACRSESDLSDIALTPQQRESAIDKAQRRARTHKDAMNESLREYLKTNRVVFLHVAEIHKVMAENSEKQAAELINGRKAKEQA